MSGSIKVGLRYIEQWKESLENQVLAYEREEAEKGQIVFYGPSNFTRWSAKWGVTPLRDELLGASGNPCVLNRGFGSSCPEQQLYYYPRMVRALEPAVLVYAPRMGNGKGFGYTVEAQFELMQRVVMYALTDFPELRVYIEGENVSKPSNISSRIVDEQWQRTFIEERARYNELLREFAENTPRCTYLNLAADPNFARADIYVADNVHYNPEGYRLYADFYRRALKDELARY